MVKKLLVSFSGGETSGLMAKLIHERLSSNYEQIITIFANTSQENEQTLEFVQRCDQEWGWNVIWLEAVIDPLHGNGTRARVVNFETACRDGSVFEAMIAKYGIPGPGFLHCTRELKENAITAYCRSIGWSAGTYDTAIGIRIDEIDRINASAKEKRFVYPLIKNWPLTKADVNAFWDKHTFRLQLKGYQGNCKWCWKKSLRKHLTIMSETPEAYDFPERMEALYPLAGSNPNNEEKRFFRDRLKVEDLRKLASEGNFKRSADDAKVYQIDMFRGFYLDVGSSCEESCEVQFDDE